MAAASVGLHRTGGWRQCRASAPERPHRLGVRQGRWPRALAVLRTGDGPAGGQCRTSERFAVRILKTAIEAIGSEGPSSGAIRKEAFAS